MTADFSAPGFYVAVRPPGSSYEERVDLSAQVISLSFEDVEEKADKLTLQVDNYDLQQFESPLWQPGNIVVFQFGYPGAMSPQREMPIQVVKGFSPLIVEAGGGEVLMNRSPRPDRYWEGMKRSDVVREIAASYGFANDQLHIEDTAIVLEQITQGPLTDFQFIRSLAAREGFEFYVDFDGLHFHRRNTKQRPVRTFTYFTERGLGDIESISTEDDRAPGKPGAVRVVNRDPATKETKEFVGADDTVGGRTTLAPERTIPGSFERISASDGTTSSSTAGPPEGSWASAAAAGAAGALMTVAQDTVVVSTEPTPAAAQRRANGIFQKQQMSAVKLSVSARGDATLLAKSVIRIDGIGPKHSGLYYVTSVKHDVAPGAVFKMTMKLKRDGHATPGGGGSFGSTTAKSQAQPNQAAVAAAEAAAAAAASLWGSSGGGGDTVGSEQIVERDSVSR